MSSRGKIGVSDTFAMTVEFAEIRWEILPLQEKPHSESRICLTNPRTASSSMDHLNSFMNPPFCAVLEKSES